MMETMGTIPLSLLDPDPSAAIQPDFTAADEFDSSMFDPSFIVNGNDANPVLEFSDLLSGFEDPFTHSALLPEVTVPQGEPDQEPGVKQPDEKLLGFSAPKTCASLLDSAGQKVDLSLMAAELCGMFFVAEDVFEGDDPGRPRELTCYRRNLWQCLCEITLPRDITHAVNSQGTTIPISELSLSMTAEESIEGKPAQIIAIPWKAVDLATGADCSTTSTPTTYSIDLANGQEDHHGRVTVKLVWKRLQFKHATANNGRRKGLQQCYTVRLHLQAKTQTGEWMKISGIQSSPVIVRGRSPRNFDSSKDRPLAGERRREKRRRSGTQVSPKEVNDLPETKPQSGSWEMTQIAQRLDLTESPPPKRQAMMSNVSRPQDHPLSVETSLPSREHPTTTMSPSQSVPSRPVTLSIFEEIEDRTSPAKTTTEVLQSSAVHKCAAGASSQSPVAEEDTLYEYFPLAMGDWMPPIEATYIPHAAHNTLLPAEFKAEEIRTKVGRYFIVDSSRSTCACRSHFQK
ncbi:hypothetical protein BGZ63DRAFT_390507 [Mariannaea sp. PMI_226]|nr:hypothetical protein BGZ63DRAFT_390507 [Mariannaea sp. PMI_226]